VVKELRGRMRGMRAFVVLTVYLTLMSGFVTLLYVLYSSSLSYAGYASGGQIGRVLFIGIVGTELFLVTFIAPTFTAGAISGERERQTYDLLRTTLLPARSLVVGKLVSALSYVLLLLLAAIPLQSIAFLFGGVTEAEVILSLVILVVTAITLGSVGIYFSSFMQRTLTASIMTYGVALFVTLGLPLIVFIIATLLNPLFGRLGDASPAIQSVLIYGLGLLISTNPLATALMTEYYLVNKQQVGFFTETYLSAGKPFQLPLVSPWIAFTTLYLIVSVILVVLAIRRVRRIEK
jgi:ABC-2 type transport system permease protein